MRDGATLAKLLGRESVRSGRTPGLENMMKMIGATLVE
jgi:hypothetical protein